MEPIFLRSYQQDAISEIVDSFEALGVFSSKRRDAMLTEIDDHGESAGRFSGPNWADVKRRVTVVCAPTASGKTLIMKGVSDQLAERGYWAITLTYVSTVATQNREEGLNSATVQKFFSAFEAAKLARLRGKPAREFVAIYLSLPKTFFEGEGIVEVDESHLGLENMTNIYDKVLRFLSNARMVVGFTATPRWRKYFHVIDLTSQVASHVAPPLGSIVFSQWIGSLPMQAALFPDPMLVFTRSVITAGIVSMAFQLTAGGRASGMIVARGRIAIEEYVRRFFLPEDRPKRRGPGIIVGNYDDEDELERAIGERHPSMESSTSMTAFRRADSTYAAMTSGVKLDSSERRLGLITLFLVLDHWTRLPLDVGRREFKNYGLVHGEVPRFANSIRLLRKNLPDLAKAVESALSSRNPVAAATVAEAASAASVLRGVTPSEFAAGEVGVATSVYKVAAGFNLPGLRTVLFAESVVGSRVLYEQRAGRGSRKIPGKTFYDLVEARYLDPYSDLLLSGSRISWPSVFVSDPAERRAILDDDLVFRRRCVRPSNLENE